MADVFEFFLHNWTDQVTMETAWDTAIVAAMNTLAEERRNLVDSPRRTISVTWTAMNRTEATRMLMTLVRMGNQRLRLPLYQDQAVTTASSSGTTINCPTDTRRFEIGKRVVIHEFGVEGRPSNVQYGVVQSFTATAITLTGALTGSYAAGAVCYPILEVEKVLGATLEVITDEHCQVKQSFMEVVPTIAESEDWAGLTGFTLVSGRSYVLDTDPDLSNSVEISMEMAGEQTRLGRDEFVAVNGPRALLKLSFDGFCEDRDAFWRLLRFFDAHRGRAIPFFVPLPLTLWEPTSVTTGYVEVDETGDISDINDFVLNPGSGASPFVLIEKTDGTLILREIDTMTDQGSTYRITPTAVFPAMNLADIRRVTLALFCRFATDTLEETWFTDSVARVKFEVVELTGWDALTLTNTNLCGVT